MIAQGDSEIFGATFLHKPVLLKEVIYHLINKHHKIYVDCTVGTGGHAEAILENGPPESRLIAIDCDIEAIKIAQYRLNKFNNRITFVNNNFKNLQSILSNLKIKKIDGILFDLGVSSLQLESSSRGFSFLKLGPLDMRMDTNIQETASSLLNTISEKALTNIFRNFGEERYSKKIAKCIVKKRENNKITTTNQLVDIIETAIPSRRRPRRIHVATKVFQALRIAVNQELTDLDSVFEKAINLLAKNGAICVIAFHSLEDRIIKNVFKKLSTPCRCPVHFPKCICGNKCIIKTITKKPIYPSREEIISNPRARSARLRIANKI